MTVFTRDNLFRACRKRYEGRFKREPRPFVQACDWLAAYLLAHPDATEADLTHAAEADKGVSPTTLAIIYLLVTVAWECWKLWRVKEGEKRK